MKKKATVPTQAAYRSSVSGKFVTEQYAKRYPNITEQERIKHPK